MNLPPDLLAQIQDAIKTGQISVGTFGRSPMRPRQLHDLRLPPTKDDPRPTFFWSAEAPRDGVDLTRTTEFPKLMWDAETGTEVTVTDAEDQGRHVARGYVFVAPTSVVIDPMDAIKAQWDALSADDQALLLESQRQDRIAMLKAKLSALPEAKLAELLAREESARTPSGYPLPNGEPAHHGLNPNVDDVRRGPGRPRKDAVA
jgi:hypothetical protein